MDFFDLCHQRRSCHHFAPNHKISKEDFKKIIELTALTPSGYNAQPWEFILIQDEARLKQLEHIAMDQKHIREAGNAVVVLGDTFIGRNADKILEDWVKNGLITEEKKAVYKEAFTRKRSPEKYKQMALRNAALAAMTFMYAAQQYGWNTCPMMGVKQLELKKFCRIPEDHIIVMLIALGKADMSKEPPRLPRKSFEEMVHYEWFGGR